MKHFYRLIAFFKALRHYTKSSIALIIVAAVCIELTSVSMYMFSSRGIERSVKRHAENELRNKTLEIQNAMTAIKVAIDNSVWIVEQRLSQPDSLDIITQRLLESNPSMIGTGLIFTPDYYPQKGHWYEPYTRCNENGVIETANIGSDKHDYFLQAWYQEAIAREDGYWSEPYYDEAGGKTMLCSYLAPVHDAKGRTVALLGADISLDWLSSIINKDHLYPTSFNVMVSRTGQLMACPVESLVMRKNIHEATANAKDTTIKGINRQMLEGKSGQATVYDEFGEKQYVFFAPVEGETGWSMAVVCSDKDIYKNLRQQVTYMLILMLVGVVLMSYIVWRTVRSARRVADMRDRETALEKELSIASNIQKALLPKMFPPYPDRNDVDIDAVIVPAKQVGGDLYDFYIRDEKLFFCIGDVAGKGIPASLVMAVTRTLFRNIIAHESKPHYILSAINNTLAEDNPSNIFVTFFVGVLDLPTGRLRYANAGHEAPVVIHHATLDCDSNLPLGVMKDWIYTLQETTLDSDTTLFLFTDGLTEAKNQQDTLYGRRLMMMELERLDIPSTPQGIIKYMAQSVSRFVNGAEQSDDLTMLTIHYTREQNTVRLKKSLTLPNDVQHTPELGAFIKDVCEASGMDNSTTMRMNLAVEEAVVNVMNYAYPKGTTGKVYIDAEADDRQLKFIITDNGIPFDPTMYTEADITRSIEERQIGGLGIHLTRHYMDSVNYERVDGQNVLTLRKKIESNIH